MSKRRIARPRLAVGIRAALGIWWLVASGCGGDNADGGSSTEAGDDQTGIDQIAEAGAGVDSPADAVVRTDATAGDATLGDATVSDASVEASEGGAHGDSGDARDIADGPDSGSCTTTIAALAGEHRDGGVPTGVDGAPDAPVGGGSDAGPSDGGREAGGDGALDGAAAEESGPDAGGPEGSQPGAEGGASSPTLLFGFDRGADGWSSSAVDRGTILVGPTAADGHSCPGALVLSATFTAFGPTPAVTYGYPSTADWTGFSRLHLWIKVTTADYSSLAAIQPFVQSNNYASGYYLYNYIDVSKPLPDNGTFSDGGWHEVVLDLAPANDGAESYAAAIVNAFGVQLDTQTAAGIGGPPAPSPTTVLVDDIWLE